MYKGFRWLCEASPDGAAQVGGSRARAVARGVDLVAALAQRRGQGAAGGRRGFPEPLRAAVMLEDGLQVHGRLVEGGDLGLLAHPLEAERDAVEKGGVRPAVPELLQFA